MLDPTTVITNVLTFSKCHRLDFGTIVIPSGMVIYYDLSFLFMYLFLVSIKLVFFRITWHTYEPLDNQTGKLFVFKFCCAQVIAILCKT